MPTILLKMFEALDCSTDGIIKAVEITPKSDEQ
jgi:hypothetical protein